jgi:hypothetical protein
MSWRRFGPTLALAVAIAPCLIVLLAVHQSSIFVKLAILVGLGSLSTVGALFATREPSNPVGWLLMVGTFGAGLNALSEGLASTADAGMARVLLVVAGAGFALHSSAFGLTALLFPNGRLISSRWRWAVWLMADSLLLVIYAAYLVSGYVVDVPQFIDDNWSFVHTEGMPPRVLGVFIAAVLSFTVALVVAGVSTIWRMRHGPPVERQQVKWVVYTVSIAVVIGLLLIAMTAGRGPSNLQLRLLYISLAAGLIASGFGIAIFRYHLYEIDKVVRLSVIYAVVVGVLGGIYALGTVMISAVLPDLGSLAVAGTTLAIAALFNPVRRRVQRAVDRRFYRTRFDPGTVTEGLMSRIRQEVDPTRLMTLFALSVEETLAPSSIGYWTGDAGEHQRRQPGIR